MNMMPLTSVLLSGVLLFSTTAQADVDQDAFVGAFAGAAAGTGIAAWTSGNIAVGFGLGGILGGLIAHAISTAAHDVDNQLDGSNIRIVDDVYGTSLLLPTDEVFEVNNQNVIREDYYIVLNQVVKLLNRYPETKISVSGHTDGIYHRGTAHYKSQAFAKAIADYLMSMGVKGERIVAVTGEADKFPIYSNEHFAGRMQNRRVEITIHQKLP